MKYNIIYLSFFFLLFIDCKGEKQHNSILSNNISKNSKFEEIPYKYTIVKNEEKGCLVNISVENINFLITLIKDKSLSFIKNEKDTVWNQTAINFYYDSSIEDALFQTRILYSKEKEFIFLFPSFGSEETIPYEILLYKDYKFKKFGVYTYDFNDASELIKKRVDINKYFWKKSVFSAEINADKVYLQSSNDGNILKFYNFIDLKDYYDNKTHNDNKINKLSSFLENNYDISATWRVGCGNALTILDISENNAYISLYSFNPTYINAIVKKPSANENTYLLFFESIESKEIYYEDKKNLLPEYISKEKPFAELNLLEQNIMNLNWIGLYNKNSKEYEFVDDNLFVRENGGKNPIQLNRCE